MNDAPLMLSVSGLRGIIGQSLTPAVATRYAVSYGNWLKCRDDFDGGPRVVVGRDSRPSGVMLEQAVVAGLVGVGCHVIRLGVVTTPSTGIMVEALAAAGGLVLTASHNPGQWNGIKALCDNGAAPSRKQAEQVFDLFHRAEVSTAMVDDLGSIEEDDTTHRVHVERVVGQIDRAAIAGRKLKVVLDSGHGAAGPVTAMLLRELGVELIHLYPEPTGRFPHPPEPLRENLEELCGQVTAHDADVGFAQDPDGDRLVVVDETGRYIGEEYTLALACRRVLERGASPQIIVTNLSTSRMVDDVAALWGATVIRTPVGEANVAAAMCNHGASAGGEGNGGVIWPPVVSVRDSLSGIGLILEMMASSADLPQSLSSLVNRMPAYAIVKDKVAVSKELVDRVGQDLPGHFPEQRVDVQDGVRIDWDDQWIHIRPSNTEPILRLIAEAADTQAATKLIGRVRAVLGID